MLDAGYWMLDAGCWGHFFKSGILKLLTNFDLLSAPCIFPCALVSPDGGLKGNPVLPSISGKSGAFPDAVSSFKLLIFLEPLIRQLADGKVVKSGTSQKTCQCYDIRSFREKSEE